MGKILKFLLPVLVLGLGAMIGSWFFINPDEAQKGPKAEAQAILVETDYAELGNFPAYIEAMGQVSPAMEVDLKTQVSGEIISSSDNFIPGGFFEKGENIITIDPADYELALKKQKAIYRQAKAEYDLEMGRQSVAKDELKILERTTGKKPDSPDLALRKPQLAQAQAELDKARSDREIAELDLSRTKVTAPFNALVTARAATLGDKVSAGETVATIVSTDEYWIELSVPVNDLAWLEIAKEDDEQAMAADIILDAGRGLRKGKVLRLTGSLDTGSRLATVLISVSDPLLRDSAANGPALILGDYARVIIQGKPLGNVARIPLSWLRDNNTVWLQRDGQLIFKPVQVIYEDRTYAYISEGVAKDDLIVTSDIAVPVENMKIRDVEEARGDVIDKMSGPKGQN